MRILLLTQYFPPETGAPQNRLFELALRLQARGHKVDVLTAMPNYPHMKVHADYKGKWSVTENMEGLAVHRSWIYVSTQRSIVRRLMNYFSFVGTSLLRGIRLRGKWDYVLCESPPLFLGITAVLLSWIKGTRLIFNVSDLWPESAERLDLISNRLALDISYRLEAWLYKQSFIVTGQTQGIVADISARFKGKRTYWLPNGVDTKAYVPTSGHGTWRDEVGIDANATVLFYGGIIGHAQGLHTLLEAAQKLKDLSVHFVLLGEGPEKEDLQSTARELNLTNVSFLDGVKREQMRHVISSIDAAVIPLRKLDLFKGAIPSKIFESLAMEKPVFLGVEGEAKNLFIDQARAGWFFEPENAQALADKVRASMLNKASYKEYGENGRRYVKLYFDRDVIVDQLEAYLNKFEK